MNSIVSDLNTVVTSDVLLENKHEGRDVLPSSVDRQVCDFNEKQTSLDIQQTSELNISNEEDQELLVLMSGKDFGTLIDSMDFRENIVQSNSDPKECSTPENISSSTQSKTADNVTFVTRYKINTGKKMRMSEPNTSNEGSNNTVNETVPKRKTATLYRKPGGRKL